MVATVNELKRRRFQIYIYKKKRSLQIKSATNIGSPFWFIMR